MTRELSSFGRFPYFPQVAHAICWRAQLPASLAQVHEQFGATLAYGNGRSYGDSCLSASDHVIHTRSLDRFIAVDWSQGILMAEAGVTLEEILRVSVPNGWFLSVLPGTKFVTVGGAVANDIHGKNHHVRGTFGRHVRRFVLLRSDRGSIECSADQNADLFRATIGGLGLTGIIECVELQLIPIRSNKVEVTEIRYGSLRDFFAISAELDTSHEYAVSWLDCTAKGVAAGRGVYTVGDHSPQGPLIDDLPTRYHHVSVTPPMSLVNAVTLKLFNNMYFRSHRRGRARKSMYFDRFFFPLDRFSGWNRLYGPKGFQQYQCVIPDQSAQSVVRELLAAIADSGRGSFLSVLKRCGDLKSPGLMSFPLPGVSLALDFPQHVDLERSLFPRLDAIVRESRGRLYPAKDAHMSAADFRRSYPSWEQVERLRDPALNSRFWQRVAAE
jgi:FAD/FMN-containing dehydrogenase